MSGKKRTVVLGVALIGAVAFLGGVVDRADDLQGADRSASVTGSPAPATTTSPAEPDTTTSRPPEPTTSEEKRAAVVDLPDVRGEILAPAHTRLTDAGFRTVDIIPVDEHAFAVNYSNWRVVGQNPAPGPVRTDTDLRLEVVKTDEAESGSCWDGDCRRPFRRDKPH